MCITTLFVTLLEFGDSCIILLNKIYYKNVLLLLKCIITNKQWLLNYKYSTANSETSLWKELVEVAASISDNLKCVLYII